MKCYALQIEAVLRRPIEPGLAALVGMMQQRDRLAATPDCHHQRIYHKLRVHLIAHRPADDLATEQIQDGGHI